MSKKYRVGIVGATGAVGQELLELLTSRNFPMQSLTLLASSRSAGKKIQHAGVEYIVEETKPECFDNLDIAIFSAGGTPSKVFVPEAAKRGCIAIDNSSAFRMDPNVPLIVPEVNPQAIKNHKNIIANPNCTTAISLMALCPLHKEFGLKRFFASTYQAVSGAGAGGPIELMGEVEALSKGETYEPKIFPYQIAFNLIPQIGGESFEGYTSEEMKMQNEGRKIMHLPELKVSCTCVRVPVVRSHSISVSCHFDVPVTVEQVRNVIANAPGVKLVDDLGAKQYPMPLDTSDQDIVFVGRIRPDLTDYNGVCLWCCGDQVRKGAATNAIQIAELLVK